MSKKVAFHNLGCKVNAYELGYVQQQFDKAGYEIVPFDQKADVYIINTCTVTNIADRKSRQMLHRARELNNDAVVVAMGCYVQTSEDEALKDTRIDLIIGNDKKGSTYQIIKDYIDGNTEKDHISDISTEHDYEDYILESSIEHTRIYVKIQDGCNQFCSYCAIPLARGRVRSRNMDSIVKEIKGLSEKGFKEIVLTGIHLSSYVSENNEKLIDVVEKVSHIEGIERIRLGSLEPRIITDEFLDRLSKVKEFCPHFHLSLQSGSDTVLKRMNRHYTTEEFFEITERIRKYFENPALTTDIIVGFPGETEEEFLETRNYLEKVNFYQVHVFKYSRRKGTVADRMPGQHTEKTKKLRSEILIKDSEIREKAFEDRFKGRILEVLFEEEIEKDGKKLITGYSREYIKVSKEMPKEYINTIKEVEF